MKKLATSLASLAALALTAAPALAVGASSDSKTGTVDMLLSEVYGVEQNGSYSVKGTKACNDAMGAFRNSELKVSYSINPSTLIMSANASYMGAEVPLYPLGISGTYSFMSDGVPQSLKDKHVNRVIFSLNTEFADPEGDVMIVPASGVEPLEMYNCVISNKPPN